MYSAYRPVKGWFDRRSNAVSCFCLFSCSDAKHHRFPMMWMMLYDLTGSLSNSQSFSLQLSWCWSLHYDEIHHCVNIHIKFVFVSANTNMFVHHVSEPALPSCRVACASSPVCFSTNVTNVSIQMQSLERAVKGPLKLTWEDVMLAMWAITPVPVRDEGPFMETYETWLAESSSVQAGTDRTGQEGRLGTGRHCENEKERRMHAENFWKRSGSSIQKKNRLGEIEIKVK